MGNFTEQILVDTARVMSQERSVINGATAMFVSLVVDFYQSMSPFLLLALVLIVADTRFGVAAARKRGERIRPSRKWRRAVNKLVVLLLDKKVLFIKQNINQNKEKAVLVMLIV